MLCCSDAQIQNILNGPSFAAFSPNLLFNKNLKEMDSSHEQQPKRKRNIKHLDRRGTNIGAVLGAKWFFGLLMIFQLLRCIASNSRNDDWKLAYITLQNKNAFLLRNIGPAF